MKHELDGVEESIGLLRMANIVLANRLAIIRVTVLSSAIVLLVLAWKPRAYTSHESFVPSSAESQGSQLAGLAAQLGVGIPVLSSGWSADFYRDYIVSDTVAKALVRKRYSIVNEDRCPCTLSELWGLQSDDSLVGINESARAVKRLIGVSTNQVTGVVDVTVTTRYPDLSFELADAILMQVVNFNSTSRAERATAEYEFLRLRLHEATDSLTESENEAKRFLSANRDFRDSPNLVLAYERLQRRISRAESAVLSLGNAADQARLEELRDTPQLTVVERASIAAVPDGRGVIVRSLAAGIAGFLFSFVVVLIRGASGRASSSEREFLEFSRQWQEFRAEVLAPRKLWLRFVGRD